MQTIDRYRGLRQEQRQLLDEAKRVGYLANAGRGVQLRWRKMNADLGHRPYIIVLCMSGWQFARIQVEFWSKLDILAEFARPLGLEVRYSEIVDVPKDQASAIASQLATYLGTIPSSG